MKYTPAVQIEEGKWYLIAFGEKPFIEECCDCGLVHKTTFKVEGGKFWVQYSRDEPRTKAARLARKRLLKKPAARRS
jgi:hypothetical protein